LLGIGGVRALRAMGYDPSVWHMNEGHAAFLVLERIHEYLEDGYSFNDASELVRTSDVFTTHTPVPAGNDEFALWLMDKYFSNYWPKLGLTRDQFIDLARHEVEWGEAFSMPVLALKLSNGRNAVSELHGRVTRKMWHFVWPERSMEEVPITHITNGIHTGTWLARRLRHLYDRYLGAGWMENVDDPDVWESVNNIPDEQLWTVHRHLKRKLVYYIRDLARERWRLLDIIHRADMPVQIIFAGKSHPDHEGGKLLIQEVYRAVKSHEAGGRLAFLEGYNMNLGRYLTQGVDVWLNTPRRPYENGVLNFSVLDGWWREGFNGQNGWAIGSDGMHDAPEVQDERDAESLYDTLENEIIPLYYNVRSSDNLPGEWIARMKESIRTLAPQFSMRRMVTDYVEQLYVPAMHGQEEPEMLVE
jgi:starch phosphorylase